MTRIRNASLRFEEDSSGREALCIVLTLADPPQGQRTWPPDDIWALRRDVLDIKTRLEDELREPIDLPWFLIFQPERPTELDSEPSQQHHDEG